MYIVWSYHRTSSPWGGGAVPTLVRERLSEQIARDLERRMRDGALQLGTQLPAERVLAAKYGVSRLVVREAIRILEARGLVYTRQGEGTFVSPPSTARDASDILMALFDKDRLDLEVVDELLLFRRYLEIALVKLAAKRVTAHDLACLRENLAAFAQGVSRHDADAIAAADENLHCRIADIGQSRVLSRIVRVTWAALSSYQKLYFEYCEKPEIILQGLTKVVDALGVGDAEAAAQAMEALLEYGDREFAARTMGARKSASAVL